MALDLDKGGRLPQVVKTYCGPTVGWVSTDAPTDIEFVLLGGGLPIVAGYKGVLLIPDWVIVNNWVLMVEVSASVIVDIWRITQAQYASGGPPTIANSICGGNLPTLAAQTYAVGPPTNWSTFEGLVQLNQNDVLGFNVNSNDNAQRLSIILQCVRIVGQK